MTEPKIHNILGVDIKCLSWSIEVNEHLLYYETPEDHYSSSDLEDVDASLDIISLRVYQRTPVGFVHIICNTIEELIEELKKGL